MTEKERAARCGCHPGMPGPCAVCRRAGRTERAVCVHLGERVDRPGQVRAWRACGHPDQPLGPLVCPCRGCDSTCPGYVRSMADNPSPA